MGFFEQLENSAVGLWVGESLFAYPFFLSLHAVGLAMVVGIFMVRDARLLGLFRGIQPTALLPLIKIAWIGFGINAISGVFLFTSQATMFVTNVPFIIKISAIFVAAILAAVTQGKLRRALVAGSDYVRDSSVKLIAASSLFLWLTAIVAGRLIAYL